MLIHFPVLLLLLFLEAPLHICTWLNYAGTNAFVNRESTSVNHVTAYTFRAMRRRRGKNAAYCTMRGSRGKNAAFCTMDGPKKPTLLGIAAIRPQKSPDNRSMLAILAIAGLFQSPNHTIVGKAAKRALGLSSKVPPHKPAITHLTFVQLVGGQQTHDLEPSLLVAAHRPQVVHARVHDNDDESDE